MFTDPTVSDFKAYFVRDFPYGADPTTQVLDADIQKAINLVHCQINQELFCDQAEYTIGFLLFSAHMLLISIQNSSQGLSSQFEWPLSSKSVGSVSVGMSIPSQINDNPVYSYYTKTGYGAQYLMMIFSRITGQMFTTFGGTNA